MPPMAIFQKPPLFGSGTNGSSTGSSGISEFQPNINYIFHMPIFQTAPEWEVLEYRIQSPAGLLYPTSIYSRSPLAGILNRRLQNVEFWNIEITAQQKLYVPQAYIPEASLLGSYTNGSRMGSSGISKFQLNINYMFHKPILQKHLYWDPV
jgi:hypothetical protein